jgi:hypothetical protein
MPDAPARAPDECANCGAAIPRGAKACPECGADERTGWRETSMYDGLDLPAEAFAEEAAPASRPNEKRRVNGIPWFWWCVGAVLIALLVFGALGMR